MDTYIMPAFNPVGIMLDFWDPKPKPGRGISFNINMINDTYEKWTGQVKVYIAGSDVPKTEKTLGCELAALGKQILPVSLTLPVKPGSYKLIAEITYRDEPVRSIRDLIIK